jgi:hypothetical protein
VPTLYPKCAPSEMLGFMVILNTHRGSTEIARLAEEENLPIDRILPAVDYAHGLGLVTVDDGQVSLTDSGRMLLAADIRVRKVLLREVLKRTILFRAILRSLEQSVDGTVAEDELAQIVAFTTAPPEATQQIINWGRYTELFRYDANQRAILPMGTKGRTKLPPAIPLPPSSVRATNGPAPTSSRGARPAAGQPRTSPVRPAASKVAPNGAVAPVARPAKTPASSAPSAPDGPKKKGPAAP